MTRGQPDIDAAPGNTIFCLSGVHNWTLAPKSGDRLIGPAVLDGAHATTYAVLANASSNVTLANLEIRNYAPGNQHGAVQGSPASGWILQDLQAHDNGTVSGGYGATLGPHWTVRGGRYFNNRQGGIGAGQADGAVVDGAELDHNNFTDDTYVKANVNCDFEAGGMKWGAASNITVKNSKVHDNACRGLWADINSNGATITNNLVYGNWADGIMIEISSGAVVTGNIVSANGFKEFPNGSTCAWMYGSGIFLSTSSHSEVAHNTVTNNCKGITGAQENRGAQYPVLEYDSIHDNAVSGPGLSGAAAADGTDLSTRHITFANNTFTNGATFCGLVC